MKNKSFQLKTVHWNCFKLSQQRQFELEHFLNNTKPDIMSLQEIKLDKEVANLRLNFRGYSTYIRTRESNSNKGGGVAILIRSGIPHTPILDLTDNLEIVGLKITINEVSFDFYSLYSPPSIILPYEFFCNLEAEKTDFIVVGDLNSKSKSIGCKSQHSSGDVLDRILDETSFIIHNNRKSTYFQHQAALRENSAQYNEILDLVISSENFSNKIIKFEVLNDYRMESDHSPIYFEICCSGNTKSLTQNSKPRLNFAKADWLLYQRELIEKAFSVSYADLELLSIDELNELVIQHINEAVGKSVPKFINRSSNSLPKSILDKIKTKKELRKIMKKSNDPQSKTNFYQIANIIRLEIKEYREKKWISLLEKFGPYPVSSSPFWNIINRAKSPKQSPSIPSLRKNNNAYKSDEEKANLFASLLKETFCDVNSNEEFDQVFKAEVLKTVSHHNLVNDYRSFSPIVIQKALESLKIDSAPGHDQIHNLFLKNIPFIYTKKILFYLVNRSIEFGMPKNWKKAKIIMIPKKDGMSCDPEKYRPISLTSCLVRQGFMHFWKITI